MNIEIESISAALEGMVAGLAASVVSVTSDRMQASGFVWRSGRIVTSDEGLAEEGEVRLTLAGGETVAAQVVGRDPSTAVALLKVDRSDLRPVAMAATIPSAGALVVAVGAEVGAPTAALGLVSLSRGPWQSMRGGEIDARIELDARLRPGRRGRPCPECRRTAFRHDRVRSASARSGNSRGHIGAGRHEARNARSDRTRLFGARITASDRRGRRFGRYRH